MAWLLKISPPAFPWFCDDQLKNVSDLDAWLHVALAADLLEMATFCCRVRAKIAR